MIVVLGGGTGSSLTRERVDTGIRLYRKTLSQMLFSGGRGEAVDMEQIALSSGVPDRSVMIEPFSTSTFENARECANLLLPHTKEITLVTHSFHMRRAAYWFVWFGFKVHECPVTDSVLEKSRPLTFLYLRWRDALLLISKVWL